MGGDLVMSNTPRVGTSSKTAKPDLWYYDRLPPTARRALANAAFDWSAGAMFNRWNKAKRGYKTGKDIADRVAQWDRNAIQKSRGSNR
jgi:hypothetical protein